MVSYQSNNLFMKIRLASLLLLIILIYIYACSHTGKNALLSTPADMPAGEYTINTDRDTVLLTKHGALLKIPQGAIDAGDQKQVTLEIKEAYTIADMIRGGLTTQSGDEPLSSGGMIYINPKKGQSATLKKKIDVALPTRYKEPGMKLFKGEETADGQLNWVNPDTLPVTAYDKKMEIGKSIFNSTCRACHILGKTTVGPDLAPHRRPAHPPHQPPHRSGDPVDPVGAAEPGSDHLAREPASPRRLGDADPLRLGATHRHAEPRRLGPAGRGLGTSTPTAATASSRCLRPSRLSVGHGPSRPPGSLVVLPKARRQRVGKCCTRATCATAATLPTSGGAHEPRTCRIAPRTATRTPGSSPPTRCAQSVESSPTARRGRWSPTPTWVPSTASRTTACAASSTARHGRGWSNCNWQKECIEAGPGRVPMPTTEGDG